MKVGDVKQAGKFYGEAVAADPSTRAEVVRTGLEQLDAGDVNAAKELLQNSASEDEAVSLFNNAGVLLVGKQDIAGAVTFFELALTAAKSDKLRSLVHFNIGLNLLKINKNAGAQEHFAAAVSLDPTNEKAHRQLEKMS